MTLKRTARRRLLDIRALSDLLRRELEDHGPLPLLVVQRPDLAQRAWREGRSAARKAEMSTVRHFRDAASQVVRMHDRLAHERGSDWFAIALIARTRDGTARTPLDARAIVERVAAAMSLRSTEPLITGWWPVSTLGEIEALEETVARAMERGARERERYAFLAAVGHELRTPLTAIRGYVETLLDEEVDARTTRRFLETVRRETLRLGRLVEGMLDFSLLDIGGAPLPAVSDVADAVAAAFDAMAPLARERRVELRYDGPPSLYASIDADMCMHILLNLLENATKHGRVGGRVEIGVRAEGTSAIVNVDDDGPGIRAEERDVIFAMHARGGGACAPGWGIGLTVVKSLVERTGGAITVESSPLGGARFVLCLPLAARKAELVNPMS